MAANLPLFYLIYRTKRPVIGFDALFSAFGNPFSRLGKEKKKLRGKERGDLERYLP
jgi:hypothetical protein